MTPHQLTIDDIPPVRRTDPTTSGQAAARQSPEKLSAGRVVELPFSPSTRVRRLTMKLAAVTGRPQTSIGKRRGDLRGLGYVEETPDRRDSPNGSPCVVWALTPAGIDAARELLAAHGQVQP